MFRSTCQKCGKKCECMYVTPPGEKEPCFVCPGCLLLIEKRIEGRERRAAL